MSEALLVTDAIANGNLNVDVETRGQDEIGRLSNGLQQMVQKLRGVIASVKIVQ